MENMGLGCFRVLDFTTAEAGPICSEYLSLMGLDVIRIDLPSARNMAKDDAYFFVAENLNKKCITVNYETEDGKALLRKLIDKADVIVENRAFGFMEKLGCGYEEVKKTNPRLVWCAIKPYAKGSPWQDAAWNCTTVDAMGTATYLTGYIGGIPVEPGPQLSNLSACGYAATGILAALYDRENTGKGQYVEVSMQDAVIAHARSAFEKFSVNHIVTRVGNAFPTVPDMVPMNLFRTKGEGPEDWALIGCMGEPMVKLLFHAMGRDDLLENPKFDTFEHRSENSQELEQIIADFAVQYEKYDLMELLLGKNRIVSSAVFTTHDVINAPDLREIGLVKKIEDEELGEMWLPACPGIFHGIETTAANPGRPGDANAEVFSEVLGLTGEVAGSN